MTPGTGIGIGTGIENMGGITGSGPGIHTLYPRLRGEWTATDGERHWAHNPETGSLTIADPADDPRLPGLGSVLGEGRLLGYRVNRRAVLAVGDGFVKVVRPRRLAAVVAAHRLTVSAPEGPVLPRVVGTADVGIIRLSRVGGVSLHELIRGNPEPGTLLDKEPILFHVARALARFHRSPTSGAPNLPAGHDPADWVATVARAEPEAAHRLQRIARSLPPLPPAPPALTHGDLHDKNILIDPCGPTVGLVDLDGVAVGTAEDDVANLGVHLGLRALQAGGSVATARILARELHGHYRRFGPLDEARLAAAELHTWFRLACLYRFRRSGRSLTPVMATLAAAAPE